ncbi:hypothetical protein GY24_17255, partial [Microterricola pindariensis]
LDGCQSAFALERAREWAAVLSAWALPQPQLSLFTGRCRVHRAELLQLSGTWQAALEEADTVSADPRAGQHERGAAGYQRAEVHRLRGEFREAEAAYKLAHECGVEPHPGLALLWLAQGRVNEAWAAVCRVLATTGPPLARARVLPAAIEIGLARGSMAEAAADVAELAGIAAAFPSSMLRTLAEEGRGLLALAEGAAGESLSPLRAAQDGWSELGAPYLAARLRASIGTALAALGD